MIVVVICFCIHLYLAHQSPTSMDRRTLPDNQCLGARAHRHVQILNDARRARESRSKSNAAANRVQSAYHELNIRKVHCATIMPYYANGLAICALFMRRFVVGNPVTPFFYETEEGEGSSDFRPRNLKKYANDHVREVEQLRVEINRSEASKH